MKHWREGIAVISGLTWALLVPPQTQAQTQAQTQTQTQTQTQPQPRNQNRSQSQSRSRSQTQSQAHAEHRGTWIATWSASPAGLPTMTKIGSFTLPTATIVKGTIRYRLRISRGGDQIRLRFSNEFGDDALVLTAASVGLAGEGLNALAGSLKRITFGGQTSITVPAGAPVLSDPILLPVKALEDLVVSVYAGGGTSVFACNPIFSFPNQAVVDGSDTTDSAEQQASPCMETIRPIVSEIDVRSDHPRNVVVAFGDSITDGRVNMKTGERGWPGVLSRRLEDSGISVINAGIGGNRLLLPLPIFGVSALARFDRDVLSVPGVSHIVLLEGVNDIGMSGPGGMFGDTPVVEPQPLIDAYLQIIARAHERGIKVVGGTLLPFAGANYYSEDKEKVRTAINRWIRTSKSFDGIVDFDAAMRNPNDPTRLKADYDSGDHLHPNDEGYRHMGEFISVNLFTR